MKKLMMLLMAVLTTILFTTLNVRDAQGMALKLKNNSAGKNSKMKMHNAGSNTVSDLSKDAFLVDFGNIPNVIWERDNLLDVAIFKKDGKNYKAFYDSHSDLIGTTSNETFADLPAIAQKEINKQYKDYTVDDVIFFKDNEHNSSDMLLYGMQFSDADNYFVELSNKNMNKNIIIQVNPEGDIFFFKELKKEV